MPSGKDLSERILFSQQLAFEMIHVVASTPTHDIGTSLESSDSLFDPVPLEDSPSTLDDPLGPLHRAAAEPLVRAASEIEQRYREVENNFKRALTQAWLTIFERISDLLSDRASSDSAFEHPRDIVDLWAQIGDSVFQELALDQVFVLLKHQWINAAHHARKARNQLSESTLHTHNIPTSAEFREVHRSLYMLRKDVRASATASTAEYNQLLSLPTDATTTHTSKSARHTSIPELEAIRSSPTSPHPSPRHLSLAVDHMRLFTYQAPHPVVDAKAVLICSSPLFNSDILDLCEQCSMIRELLSAGITVHLLAWISARYADQWVALDDYVAEHLHAAIQHIRRTTKEEPLHVLGVEHGGTLATIYTALYPEHIRSLILVSSPIDFALHHPHGTYPLHDYLSKLNVNLLAEAMDIIPIHLLDCCFALYSPFQRGIQKYLEIADQVVNPSELQSSTQIEQWRTQPLALPSPFVLKLVRALYQENQLLRGELGIYGQTVSPSKIVHPVLHIFGPSDKRIPAASALPLTHSIGNSEPEIMRFSGDCLDMLTSPSRRRLVVAKVAGWLKYH